MRPSIFLLLLPLAGAQERVLEMRDALVLAEAGASHGRSIVHGDAVELAIVRGSWQPPVAAGETGGWVAAQADAAGRVGLPDVPSGYVWWEVESTAAGMALLQAEGHLLVYANGEVRSGDPYRAGYVRLPVALHAGKNGFLFRYGRGAVKASLCVLEGDRALLLDEVDSTLPDLIRGETEPAWASLRLTNASGDWARRLEVRASLGGGDALVTGVPDLAPCSVHKVAFRMPAAATAARSPARVLVTLSAAGDTAASLELAPAVVDAGQQHRRTFRSDIDGSVQYYAVKPARPVPGAAAARPALFLTLHGASVEASGQAGSYAAKSWGHLVAPTNRRPYGFDWEDWGRRDAIEVLEHAAALYGTDPQRVYLTGHSMGGHGTWHLGVTFPDRFAALGPSAGWVSFWSYGGKRKDEGGGIAEILARASSPSDTLGLAGNLLSHGVYVLHGDADDNVRVDQARQMRAHLDKLGHRDLHFHEQPGAGHWWGSSTEPGEECVDWPPMFDLFARRSRPVEVRRVDFRTACPGVSADCHWLRIEAQEHDLQISHADISMEPGRRRFSGTTENVARLSLSVAGVSRAANVLVELDGTALEVPWPASGPRITLRRAGDTWQASPPALAAEKGPHRYGLMRSAFDHRALLVAGTAGTPEETSWALARARLDAEVFWVRGNGAFLVITDTELLARRGEGDRNVVLYGNADTNAAWSSLLGDSPLQVRRGAIELGGTRFTGDDLAALFIRPRPGSDTACVGVISGSGAAGQRLTDRLPLFISGVALPDLIVLSTEMLATGYDGILAAGFFGKDWGLESGELVLRDL